MIDISVSSLVKSFELGKNILDGLTFTVNSGERVGILGHNGCGKTTLFRILAGEIGWDEGEVMVAPSKRLGLISQIPVYPDGWTTEDVLRSAHKRLYEISDRLDELGLLMEHDQSPALLQEYDRLSDDFRRLGGYDMDTARNRVANGLDIPAVMREQASTPSPAVKRPASISRGSSLRTRIFSFSTSRRTTSTCALPSGLRTTCCTSRALSSR